MEWCDVRYSRVPDVGVPFVASILELSGARCFILYCFDGSEDYSLVDDASGIGSSEFWDMGDGGRITHYLLLPPFDE